MKPPEHQSFWLWVMCLTGVDYFSTLGYQPSIAFEAVGLLAPLATIVLIAVTLGCALPVYSRVAEESPLGHGSISMLERLLHGWTAKFLVLVLLGFAATDFVITQTLSAADAAEHLIHNPFWADAPPILQSQMLLTIGMLLLLGAMFLRGLQRSDRHRGRDRGRLSGAQCDRAAERHCLPGVSPGHWWPAWYQSVLSGDWHMEHEGSGLAAAIFACLIFFPEAGAGAERFRNGRGRDAAGARRAWRRSAPPARPHSQYAEAAGDGRRSSCRSCCWVRAS